MVKWERKWELNSNSHSFGGGQPVAVGKRHGSIKTGSTEGSSIRKKKHKNDRCRKSEIPDQIRNNLIGWTLVDGRAGENDSEGKRPSFKSEQR